MTAVAARLVPLAAGIALLITASLVGRTAELLDTIVSPPALVRAALVGAMVALAIWLLHEAVVRLEGSGRLRGTADGADLAAMLRGIRFVFLALGALAAAAGWLVASPLPLVLAGIIAGVDVVETSFLLLVVSVRGSGGAREEGR